MSHPLAGPNQFPFTPDGLKVNGAKIKGTDYVGTLTIYQQRSDKVFDLIDSAFTVYQFVQITDRDKAKALMDATKADAALTADLDDNTFFIKETDPVTGITGFSTMYQIHKIKLGSGQYIFKQNKIRPAIISVTGVAVAPKTLAGDVGGSGQLTATVQPTDATDKSVSWLSSAPTIATVSASGLVSYLASGSATITATTTDGSFTDTCAITVSTAHVPVDSVSVTPATITANVGDSPVQLTANVLPANATDKTVSWVSADPAVCTVDSTGLVTIIGAGTCNVTATSNDDNTKEGVCTVTVS